MRCQASAAWSLECSALNVSSGGNSAMIASRILSLAKIREFVRLGNLRRCRQFGGLAHDRKPRPPPPARRQRDYKAGPPPSCRRACGRPQTRSLRAKASCGQDVETLVADHADDPVRQAAANHFFPQHEHGETLVVHVRGSRSTNTFSQRFDLPARRAAPEIPAMAPSRSSADTSADLRALRRRRSTVASPCRGGSS